MLTLYVNKTGYHFLNYNNSFKNKSRGKRFFGRAKRLFVLSEDDVLRISLSRTRSIIRRIILNQDFSKTSFLTLTFKDDKFSDFDLAVKSFIRFVDRLNYYLYKTKKRVLKYLCVPEVQKRGVWHFHCVLFDVPYVDANEVARIWGNGFIKINQVRDEMHLVNYLVKYLTKDLVKTFKNRKRVFASRDMYRGVKFSTDDENVIKFCFEKIYTEHDYRCIYSYIQKVKDCEGKEYEVGFFQMFFSKDFIDFFRKWCDVKVVLQYYHDAFMRNKDPSIDIDERVVKAARDLEKENFN